MELPAEPSKLSVNQIPSDLGKPIEEFPVGVENPIAGVIISILMVTVGSGGIIWAIWKIVETAGRQPFFSKGGPYIFAILLVPVIGALVGGLFALRYSIRLFSRTVCVCENGLFVVYSRKRQVIPWSAINSIEEVVTQDYFPLKGVARHALPMGKSRTYRLTLADGQIVGFDGDTTRRIGRFGQLLEEKAEQIRLTWNVTHINP
ncbi:MAG: hypothetical protein ACJ8F7_12385 [Gemmataceae bacterium]